MNELVVYLSRERVGRLILKENGNLQFRYDHGYVGPAISQTLPLQAAAHPHERCLAVFGGLLLEGDSRDALARNIGVSSTNDYALLRAIGGDCAGAVILLAPEAELPSLPRARPLEPEALDTVLHELPQRPLAANPQEGIRLSLAGAQPKLPVIVDDDEISLPLNVAAATTHIIKPEPMRFPGLVDNEAFCMELARAVDLPCASVSKHTSSSGLPYLLVERYDRDLTSEPIRRLHQEDFCQALGRTSEHKYQADGGPTIAETIGLIRACSAVPAQDLRTFWRALLFNWLIGNCDAHAKNFSLLYDAQAPTLAPLYDLVSTTVYPELTTRLAMTIDGARDVREITHATWERLAQEAGYSARFAKTETESMIQRVNQDAVGLSDTAPHQNQIVLTILAGIVERSN